MDAQSPDEVTRLLEAIEAGESEALGKLLPLVYDELHAIARQLFEHERPTHTLQPTALVHDAYIRLAGIQLSTKSRRQFFAVCARIMRQVLVDHARKRDAAKRGGLEWRRQPLDAALDYYQEQKIDFLAFNEVLEQLRQANPRWAEVVTLRMLGGLSVEETAAELQVSERTVHSDYQFALAVIRRQLG